MITLTNSPARFISGKFETLPEKPHAEALAAGRGKTMAYQILAAHHAGTSASARSSAQLPALFNIRFDALASHDITFVNIVQTAKESGLKQFPVPYVLTNCHNSLCAVGGTINEDDHRFGLSAAIKYGGVFVPPHLAVIHSYMRETFAGCGNMILGSDSHTRYGALGTLAVGEGGGELVKQILSQTYDIAPPDVIAVRLFGKPRAGVGPQDVALAIIGAVFKNGFVKNKIMEFVGDGIANLPIDFRAGVDVMTTETACLSSIWETDDEVKNFLALHKRPQDYRRLSPVDGAVYDGLIEVDLSAVSPMIALPFHPSNVYTIDDFQEHTADILRAIEKDAERIIESKNVKLNLLEKLDEKGRFKVDQAVIAGCAGGTFDNIMAAAGILDWQDPPVSAPPLSVYPGSQPVMLELMKNGAAGKLIAAGAVVKTAFCGPCFGAGDVPANNGFSIRHTTRNFPNREGSKPSGGQIAAVALMDARSIAATVRNGGFLTSAEDMCPPDAPYRYDDVPYRLRVYNGWGSPQPDAPLRYGPNITDWPPIPALGRHLLLKIVSFITDDVTTTDEIIPSGETSSFRSNPIGLAEYTLSRKDPSYVEKAKNVRDLAALFPDYKDGAYEEFAERANMLIAGFGWMLKHVTQIKGVNIRDVQFGSAIFAKKPGDGSAREQAASCQRVLGGCANFANEYATKRYRSNLINWGMLPFTIKGDPPFKNGDYVFIPNIRDLLSQSAAEDVLTDSINAFVIDEKGAWSLELAKPKLSDQEKELILAGCLMNYNKTSHTAAS
jgi:aconitate hydratase